ncbi:MAG: radical SAM protein [Armatimonadetes bacterium]|nr:radical SAM protein [Armatimonadota bacterium]NIO75295.1 radical SAM protein [Armatimonadota bacterium]NIO95855.1 radical SAM protein [Armatimonadota bacterium]
MTQNRPKLLIIAPAWSQGWWGGGKVLAPPLVLPLLAALSPADVDVQLLDENVEAVDTNADVDWVAITCMTASAPRAYAISDAFRRRGIPVVMGGIHPTVLPEEAAAHADAVVIGEAEPLWREVLADLAASRLRPRYRHDGYSDLIGLPHPRRDLLRVDRYLTTNVVQTGRGCPNACSFCTVSTTSGRQYRFRPIPEVVEEVRSLSSGWVGFVDDNIAGNARRAKDLFAALIPLKRRWIGQADLTMARDPELLSLAARSGCQAMFIGLESLSEDNLRATHKVSNVGTDMGAAITTIHKAGIEIIGSFVLGLDGDDCGVFARTVEFAQRHKLVAAQFAVLTPFPGTAMRQQLDREGRIVDHDWSHYTMSNVVFRPRHMTDLELRAGQKYVYGRFYSLPSILKRSFTVRRKFLGRLLVNLSYRGIHRGKGIHDRLPAQRLPRPLRASGAP